MNRDSRFKPANYLEIGLAAIDLIWSEIHGQPTIGLARGSLKSLRHYTYDLKVFSFKPNFGASHLRVRSELTPPQFVADNRYVRTVFFTGKVSAETGPDAQ